MQVVLGVTGHTGAVVAQMLLEKKQPVRVVVRSAEKGATWKAKGADVAVADLEDVPALTRAFQGATGAYLLVPPNYGAQAWLESQRRRMDRAAEAVAASRLPHVVFLSSIGGHLAEGTGPIRAVHYGERALVTATPNLTILRPPYFIDNWGPGLGAAKAQGVLPTFIAPQAKVPMISTRDIGRIGAEQLLVGGQGRRVLELMGPEFYSPDDVAAALGRLLGRAVTSQLAPLSAVVPTFKSFGFSEEAARLFEEMYAGFGAGSISYEAPDQVIRGTVPLEDALATLLAAGEGGRR